MKSYKTNRLCVLAALMLLPFAINAMGLQEPYKVTDQSGGIGAAVPAWYNKSRTAVEKEFPGSYAFVMTRSGKNLKALQLLANKVDVGSAVAQEISVDVQNLVVSAVQGTDVSVEEYVETLSKNVSKAKISGLRKEQDWWIQKTIVSEDGNDIVDYDYKVLYLVDKKTIQDLINQVATDSIPSVDAELKNRVASQMEKLIKENI